MTSDARRKARGSWRGSLWVSCTTLLISFIAYSSQLFVILPTYPRGLDTGARRWLILFNAVVGLIFWNYAVCILTDPGGVPKDWKTTSEARFCRACNAYKPPRAHHCRHCRRCTLRMDHHDSVCSLAEKACLIQTIRPAGPWINVGSFFPALSLKSMVLQNCVGHRNYAAFIRFLFLVDMGIGMHLYKISQCAFGRAVYNMQPTTGFMIMLVLNYVASIPVLIAVGVFSIYHLWCLLSNATTIEGFEREKVVKLYRRGHLRHDVPYPFDLGVWGNITAVFGANVMTWSLPWHQPPGDGLSFSVRAGSDAAAQYAWPPKDPFRGPRIRDTVQTRLDPELEVLACPPFAQDYDTGRSALDMDDDDDNRPLARRRYRRGSEGIEIRPLSANEREAMIRPLDRYQRYDPNDEDSDLSSDD